MLLSGNTPCRFSGLPKGTHSAEEPKFHCAAYDTYPNKHPHIAHAHALFRNSGSLRWANEKPPISLGLFAELVLLAGNHKTAKEQQIVKDLRTVVTAAQF